MRNFRDIKVWEKAHRLTLAVYQATADFPAAERFGLTSQARRAAASVPANIAEGCGRDGEAELARFFQIALGSANELEYHLLLARDLRFMSKEQFESLATDVNEVKRMLYAFIRSLRTGDEWFFAYRVWLMAYRLQLNSGR